MSLQTRDAGGNLIAMTSGQLSSLQSDLGITTDFGKVLISAANEAGARAALSLGSASLSDASAFATATQGLKADNAVQSSLLGLANGVATLDANAAIPVNQKARPVYVTASRNLTAADNGAEIYYNGATDITLTIPAGLSSTFRVESFNQIGAGKIIVVAGSGVTKFGTMRTCGVGTYFGINATATDYYVTKFNTDGFNKVTIYPSGDVTGVTDLANLQAAHDAVVAGGKGVVELAAGGTYYIADPGMSWRMHKVMLRGNNASVVCLGSFLNPTAVSGDPQYGSVSSCIENLRIVGPGQTGNTSVCLTVSSSVNALSPRLILRNVYIDSFYKGILFQDRAYLCHFVAVEVGTCNICIHQAVGNDSGENISWHGGAIGNSYTALLLEDDSSEFNMFGVSFDYVGVVAIMSAGAISLYGCHIELSSGITQSPVQISGDGTYFQMIGGNLGIGIPASGDNTYPSFVNFSQANNRASFVDVKMFNIKNVANKFATGPGLLYIERLGGLNVLNYNSSLTGVNGSMSLLVDGDMEQTGVRDHWYISANGSNTYTSRNVGTAVQTITKSTNRFKNGTQSLMLTSDTAGASAANAIGLMVRCAPGVVGQRLFGEFYIGKDAAANDLSVYMYWVKTGGIDTTTFRPSNVYSSLIFSTSITGIDTVGVGTRYVISRGGTIKPVWADAFIIVFNMVNFGAALSTPWTYYIDDFVLEIA
jgi:hypothetical protein